MKIQKNQLLNNVIHHLGGQVTIIPVRVIDPDLSHLGSEPMARVTDAREVRDDAWLIANDRTWACPIGNLREQDGGLVHATGLVVLGGAQ